MHASVNIAKKFIDMSGPSHDITPMKLLKLVYIAHGWMLGLYDRELIAEDVYAWQYGPVIPELYNKIKIYRYTPVIGIDGAIDVQLSHQENDLLRQVANNYGKFNGLQLSAITHAPNTPWDLTWKADPKGIIPDANINAYYKSLANIR